MAPFSVGWTLKSEKYFPSIVTELAGITIIKVRNIFKYFCLIFVKMMRGI
jgi:hypothetical protein